MKSLALALAFAAIAAAPPQDPQDPQPVYKFLKDEVQKYEVVGELRLSLKGSHPDLIEKGIEVPLRADYRGVFENAVKETGGRAKLERKVRSLKVTGDYKGEAFRIDFDRDRPKDKQFSAREGPHDILQFFGSWCQDDLRFTVDGDGTVELGEHDKVINLLVVKAGMMYWPAKTDATTWVSRERLAVPLLHHKILLDFQNKFDKTFQRGNRTFMKLEPKTDIAGSEPPPPELDVPIRGDFTFKASGNGLAEIDLTRGRLINLKLDVAVHITGTAPVAGGKKGDFRGEVTYKETQQYKDK